MIENMNNTLGRKNKINMKIVHFLVTCSLILNSFIFIPLTTKSEELEEEFTISQKYSVNEELKKSAIEITNSLYDDVKTEKEAEVPTERNPSKESRKVGSLFRYLLLHYAKTYVLKTLPKKIYKKLPFLFRNMVSEKKFLEIWENTIRYATLGGVGKLASQNLKKIGVWFWLADGIGDVIQAAIDILL